MASLLDWLSSVPTTVLYLALAAISAIENVFPPVPADTVVAFGSFLAARGHGTAAGAFLATFAGNMFGAMAMYAAGRRYGAAALQRRMATPARAQRLQALYGRYGLAALFASRFVPGVRAIVPPFAGALRLPAARVALVLGTASALWYGIITVLAFRVGSDWDTLSARVGEWGRWMFIGAGALVAAMLAVWFAHRRQRGRA